MVNSDFGAQPAGPAPTPWSCHDCGARFVGWDHAERHIEKTGHGRIDLILCRPTPKETRP